METLPWIALALAASFGSYGLVKKKAPLPSLEGLRVETAVLVVPAALYLAALDRNGSGAFLHAGAPTDLLLVAGGVVTVVPLLLFATAVRRVPLSVIGILQYIAPTIQFLLGCLRVPRTVHADPVDRLRPRLAGPRRVQARQRAHAEDRRRSP